MFVRDFGIDFHFNVFCHPEEEFNRSYESVEVSAFMVLSPCHLPIKQASSNDGTELSVIGEVALGTSRPPSEEQRRRLRSALSYLKLLPRLEESPSGVQGQRDQDPLKQSDEQAASLGKCHNVEQENQC